MKAKHMHSSWFMMCVEDPNLENSSWLKDFRKLFKVPYHKHKEMLSYLRINPLFSRWWDHICSCVGVPLSPLEFLLLGALRCLGSGWNFDDASKSLDMSATVVSYFLEICCTFGSTEYYDKNVIVFANEE